MVTSMLLAIETTQGIYNILRMVSDAIATNVKGLLTKTAT